MDLLKKIVISAFIFSMSLFSSLGYAETVTHSSNTSYPPHSSSISNSQINKYLLFMREISYTYKKDNLYGQIKDAQGNSQRINILFNKLTSLVNDAMKKQNVSSQEIDLVGKELIKNKDLSNVVNQKIKER